MDNFIKESSDQRRGDGGVYQNIILDIGMAPETYTKDSFQICKRVKYKYIFTRYVLHIITSFSLRFI